MGKVIKEFYVDEYDLENMSCFTVSRHPVPMRDRTLKITISYEIDREITINESDLENALKDISISGHSLIELGVMGKVKKKLFGGGENDI